MGRENKEVGEMPTSYHLTVMCCQPCLPNFQYFKVVYHEHLLHFLPLLCQSCRSLRNVSLGGRILGLIKSSYHGWLSMMMSSEGLLFSLASGPPSLNPTTDYYDVATSKRAFLHLLTAKFPCVEMNMDSKQSL